MFGGGREVWAETGIEKVSGVARARRTVSGDERTSQWFCVQYFPDPAHWDEVTQIYKTTRFWMDRSRGSSD